MILQIKNINGKILRKSIPLDERTESKNTGAWKGRLKRFFVNPYPEELAKNGANVI